MPGTALAGNCITKPDVLAIRTTIPTAIRWLRFRQIYGNADLVAAGDSFIRADLSCRVAVVLQGFSRSVPSSLAPGSSWHFHCSAGPPFRKPPHTARVSSAANSLPLPGVVRSGNEPARNQKKQMTTATKLHLGQILITPAAQQSVHPVDVLAALNRHANGDWGDCGEEDWKSNQQALVDGTRILSVYHDRTKQKFWIITEASRIATTILLPEDY